jgi:imidazolonepropionase-like amidohydrolase
VSTFTLAASAALALSLATAAAPQSAPINGMREAEPGPQALIGGTVVPKPGQRLERGVILVREGRIERVGDETLPIPEGYRVWPCHGLTLYPGLIEPALLLDSREAMAKAASGKGAHWNRKVVPQISSSDLPPPSKETLAGLHRHGFVVAQTLPDQGIFRGTGTVILLDEDAAKARTLRDRSTDFVAAEFGGSWEAATYPGSLMGVLALERQTMLEARWFAAASEAWRLNPAANEPPIDATALAALGPAAAGERVVLFDAENEKTLLRQARVAQELGAKAVLLGSGTEFRRVASLAATGFPLLVPPRYPVAPDVTSLAKAERIGLRDLWTWELAPTNAARLEAARIPFAFTTAKLDEPRRKEFRQHIRTAIAHGLGEDAALAAVTIRPATILGLASSLGTIEPGKVANIVAVDGFLFGDESHDPGPVRTVWVAGRAHAVEPAPSFALDGRCRLLIEGQPVREAELDRKEQVLVVELAPAQGDQPAKRVTVKPFRIDGDRFACSLDSTLVGREGVWRTGGVAIGEVATGRAEGGDGTSFAVRLERSDAPRLADPERARREQDEATSRAEQRASQRALAERPVPFPFAEFGPTAPPAQQTVLIRGATVWTMTDQGILADTDLLVRDGRVAAIGAALTAPAGALVIEAKGRHVTPGLIDCHSHTGIDGGVNEWTQTNTAECAIGDVIDAEDVNWYRQLAGGLVAANQLHGSANPIGGRNSVVKLRWGEDEAAFPVEGAIPGIKFALGENVTRTRGRYPDTRMGVEAFLDDAFDAARRHAERHAAWTALPPGERLRIAPPRPDLELDALAEILASKRLVHCHSYRQDEILMLLALAERQGFRVGTLQHVLEGFKVADAIARHGAGASSFSDWWAYKVEVMDAIPHNGAVLHDQGVLTSFNSDSNELARRMNMEAAKAVRYGGLSPEDALAFVTINPAKQLRIDDRTGSLAVGKDADFVLWSADPLSVYARVDETWVDGVRRFERKDDEARAAAVRLERQRLLAKAADARAEERAKARRERDRSEDAGAATAPATPSETGRRSLLATLLDGREAFLMELVRRGGDPTEIRVGECGCGRDMGGAR